MKPLKIKKRKPRTATWRKVNKYLERCGCEGGYCGWFDGFDADGHPVTECSLPGKMTERCTGNIFDCIKERYRFLASLNETKRKRYIERYGF